MRKGNPGKWWVLKRIDAPLYWTGEIVEHPIQGEQVMMPMFAMVLGGAQQFRTEADAMFMHTIFGLASEIVPAELEFAPS
jgi:hypothetical protein